MNSKVKEVLKSVLERFRDGDIPEAISYSLYPIPDIPCAKWSLLNRMLMFFGGTSDARGYRQWKQVNRYVKKGSTALYILVPFIKKVADSDDERQMLYGFGCKPVFRVEDTDGEPLEYEKIEVPDFPLLERAKEWGISVKAIPGRYRFHGVYFQERKEISLATPEEKVFFHELSHAGHGKIKGRLVNGQDALQEIVAELCAAILCKLVGKQQNDTLGNSYRYIERYAGEIKLNPYSACLKVISETEKVLNLILNGSIEEKENANRIAA
ncbi:MAG: antirestriction protein [Pseudomonadota bacterium]